MGLLYHLLPASSWSAAVSANEPYTPATFEQDGFTHLTADPALLITVLDDGYGDFMDRPPWWDVRSQPQSRSAGNRPFARLMKDPL